MNVKKHLKAALLLATVSFARGFLESILRDRKQERQIHTLAAHLAEIGVPAILALEFAKRVVNGELPSKEARDEVHEPV